MQQEEAPQSYQFFYSNLKIGTLTIIPLADALKASCCDNKGVLSKTVSGQFNTVCRQQRIGSSTSPVTVAAKRDQLLLQKAGGPRPAAQHQSPQ
jgi:hypothetical protein